MLNFSEFLKSFQEANSIQTNETNIQEIDQDINYWSNLANQDQSEKFTIDKERVKQTLRNIVTYYLEEGQKIDGIDYSEYSKYFSEDHPENYLFNHLINKLDPEDVKSVPEFMVQMILFFDQVSKLSSEDKKRILGEFPMSQKDDYVCLKGIEERLTIVSSKLKSPQVQIAIGHIAEEGSKFFKFLDQGIEIHSAAALSHMICGSTNDTYWHQVPKKLPANEVWKFAREFNDEVNNKFKKSDDLKSLQTIRKSYDDFMAKRKKRDDQTVDLSATEGDDKAFLDNCVFATFFKNQLNIKDNDLLEKFFNSKTGDFLFDENGETLLEIEIEKLEKKYQEIDIYPLDISQNKTKSIREQVRIQKENDISDVDLYDPKLPEKIAKILLSEDSIPSQKHLAVQALFIMSEKFKGNSKVNLIKTLHLIGLDRVTEEDLNGFSEEEKDKKRVEIAIKKSKEVLNDLLQDQNVPDSTKNLIKQSFDTKIKVGYEDLDLIDRILNDYKCYEIVEGKISVDDFVSLKCPAELFSSFEKNLTGVIAILLNEEDPYYLQKNSKIIFYNPKKIEILQAYFSYQSDNPEIIENKKFICLDMAYEALRTNDLDLLKFLIENAEKTKMFGDNAYAIEDHILGNIVPKKIFWDKKIMEYLFNRLSDENGIIKLENLKILLPKNDPEYNPGFLTSAIIDGQKDIILKLFDSLESPSLKILLNSETAIYGDEVGLRLGFSVFNLLINSFDYKSSKSLIEILEKKVGEEFVLNLIFGKRYKAPNFKNPTSSFEELPPLNYAAIEGTPNLIEMILDKVSKSKIQGCGNVGVLDLINRKSSFGHTPIFDAIAKGNIEIAELLFNKINSINPKSENRYLAYHLSCKTNEGDTIIHVVASSGNVDSVKFVLEKLDKIDKKIVKKLLTSKNKNGASILDEASISRNREIFGLLLERIDDKNLRLMLSNHNPLSIAASFNKGKDLGFEEFIISKLSSRISEEELNKLIIDAADDLIRAAIKNDDAEFLNKFIGKFGAEALRKFISTNGFSGASSENQIIKSLVEKGNVKTLEIIIRESESIEIGDLSRIRKELSNSEKVDIYDDENFAKIILPALKKTEESINDKIGIAQLDDNCVSKIFNQLFLRSDISKIKQIVQTLKKKKCDNEYFQKHINHKWPYSKSREWSALIRGILLNEHQKPNNKKQEAIAFIVNKIDIKSHSNEENAELLYLLIRNGELNGSFDLIPSVLEKIGKHNIERVLDTSIEVENRENNKVIEKSLLEILIEKKQDMFFDHLMKAMDNRLDIQFVQYLLDNGIKISEQGIGNIREGKSQDKEKILLLVFNQQKNSEGVPNEINPEVVQSSEEKKKIEPSVEQHNLENKELNINKNELGEIKEEPHLEASKKVAVTAAIIVEEENRHEDMGLNNNQPNIQNQQPTNTPVIGRVDHLIKMFEQKAKEQTEQNTR